jgi:hypothetical protein
MNFIGNEESDDNDSGDDSDYGGGGGDSSDIDKSCLQQPTDNLKQQQQTEVKVKNRWTKEEVCIYHSNTHTHIYY